MPCCFEVLPMTAAALISSVKSWVQFPFTPLFLSVFHEADTAQYRVHHERLSHFCSVFCFAPPASCVCPGKTVAITRIYCFSSEAADLLRADCSMDATAGSFSRECTKWIAPLPMRYTAPAHGGQSSDTGMFRAHVICGVSTWSMQIIMLQPAWQLSS